MDTNEMEAMLYEVDNDKVANLMSDMLMDTDVTTYDMFEELVVAYNGGNEDFRKGMDKALETLLWYNMNDIVSKVKDECMKKDEDE